MADYDGGPGPVDGRTHIWVHDDIFMPDHNKVMRYITSRFALQTCDEGHSWKYVTADQRAWYWDEFVKKYRWDDGINENIRQLWCRNVATLYRRTIQSWSTTGRYPETVSEARWAAWTAAWHDQCWLDRSGKNKANRSSEPAGPGTGTSKYIVGSNTYSAYYNSMQASQGIDPSLWDMYLHTHRRPDGSFVNKRSKLVYQSMEALRDESLTPLDDETIPDQPSSEEVNSTFKHVVGGRNKGRMHGCGSMTSMIYPDEMAPRRRGGGSRSSQDSQSIREVVEQQNRVLEYLRVDLQALQRREEERDKENELLRSRLSSVEDQIRLLVSGMPQVPPTHRHTQSHDQTLHGRDTSSRGRSIGHLPCHDPHAASSYRDDRLAASSSRPDVRGKVLRVPSSYHRRASPPPHRFSQQLIDPSHDFGFHDDDGYDDGGYDDDETEIL